MSVYAPCVCWRPKECIGTLELELRMIVSRPVGPGHQTQILCKEQPVFLASNHL